MWEIAVPRRSATVPSTSSALGRLTLPTRWAPVTAARCGAVVVIGRLLRRGPTVGHSPPAAQPRGTPGVTIAPPGAAATVLTMPRRRAEPLLPLEREILRAGLRLAADGERFHAFGLARAMQDGRR